ncbi:hypothetical protein M9H77_02725 [Catharanthus roseus]|uniref:Uncharacterized protein n=1 Tax=Catharanthus roseus TaxID=4058 RepID=A0ACC0C9D8_CATRO|nr:hypothetical protein M9H77_02725 [Catharanthus roseus]
MKEGSLPTRIEDKGRSIEKKLCSCLDDLQMSPFLNLSLSFHEVSFEELKFFDFLLKGFEIVEEVYLEENTLCLEHWKYLQLLVSTFEIITHLDPLETAVTKGRRKTNSTKRDKSHWEYVSIAHRKIRKSSSSGSGSGSGSGSNPSPRRRGRPPRSGRSRGRGSSSGRSSLLTVVSPDSPPVPFPFKNAFSGDENHWIEIRRRMIFDLRHHMRVYEQLFGSVERVTELIMQTNWEDGSAPRDHWMNIPDHLYVIANTFNLCVVFLARSQSTTVLPLVSNMDGPSGTIFVGLIEELQHFIQMDALCPYYMCNGNIIEIYAITNQSIHA